LIEIDEILQKRISNYGTLRSKKFSLKTTSTKQASLFAKTIL